MKRSDILLYGGIGLFVFLGVVSSVQQSNNQKNLDTLEAVYDDVEGLSDEMAERMEQGDFRPVEPILTINYDAPDDVVELQKLMVEVAKQRIEIGNAYLLAMESTDWNRIWDGDRLEKDQDMLESSEIIRQTKELNERYRRATIESIEQARARIDDMNLTETQKNGIRDGFDRDRAYMMEQLNLVWEYEGQIFTEVEKAVALLGEHRDEWQYVFPDLVIDSPTLLDTFNQQMMNIDELVRKQDETYDLITRRARQRFE